LRDGRITRRGFLARAAGLLGGLAAAEGLLARVTGAQTTKKTDFIVAQSGDVSMLDPQLSTGVWEITVTFNLYDNLLSRHPDGKLYPGLATEWKLVNPTVWQFKLRPGARFHNGDPVTSADVKFSIDRTYDPNAKGSMVRTVFTTIDRIDTPDALTVTFLTKQPDPLLPARLAFYGGQIMPKKYFEAVGADTFNRKPVGSGPVKFVDWVKDDRVTLDAYADYWGGKIDADRVVFRPIPEAAPRIAALLKGEVDVITKLPPDHVERVAKHPTTRVEGALYAGLYVLAVNHKVPPLDNPKVKQALSLAIDREAIVKDLWRGQGIVPTNGPIAKGDNHFDESLPPLPYNPTLAKQRLKEAGYKGEEVIIESSVGFLSNDRAMCETIIAMWRDVGVNARFEIIEASVRAQKRRDKTYKGLWLADPTSTLSDPDGMMWRLLGPNGILDYWRQPRFDELGNAARFSIDEKFRAQAYRDMTQIFHEHWLWIPIIQPIESYGLQKYVDWKPNSNQQFDVRAFNFKFRRA
ncbi:MAG: ABC transporter substrate-binding protein, partial [Actinomycetota bacterium]